MSRRYQLTPNGSVAMARGANQELIAKLTAAWHSMTMIANIAHELDITESQVRYVWRQLQRQGLLPDGEREVDIATAPLPRSEYLRIPEGHDPLLIALQLAHPEGGDRKAY